MRAWIWTSLAASALLVGGAVLSIKPAARWAMEKQARARHLQVHADDLELGLFTVNLRKVKVGFDSAPSVHAEFEEVRVDLSLGSPRVNLIRTNGGRVVLSGDVDTVSTELRAWRALRGTTTEDTDTESASSRKVFVRDLDLIWKDALEPGVTQQVLGFNLEHTKSGTRLGADLVEAKAQGLDVQIAGTTLELTKERRVASLGAAEMRVIFSAKSAVAANANSGAAEPPSDAPSSANPEPAPSDDDTIEEADSGKNALVQMLEPHPERTAKLQAALALLRSRVLPHLPESAAVERLWLTYVGDKDQIRVGPNQLKLNNGSDKVQIELTPREKVEGTPLSLRVTVPKALEEKSAGDAPPNAAGDAPPNAAGSAAPNTAGNAAEDASAAISLDVSGGPIYLSALGVQEGAFGLQNVVHTSVQGSLQSALSSNCSIMRAEGSVTVEGLTLANGRLSDRLVVFPRLAIVGKGNARTDGSALAIEDVALGLGEARFSGNLALSREGEAARVVAQAKAPLVSCQALIDSAPRGLLDNIERMRMTGTFSLDASINAKTDDVAHMEVHWDFKNACRATGVPAPLDPEQFRGLFEREVLGAGGFPMQMEFGPFSSNWTPYDSVSPYLEAALLVSEDGRFFRHDGFDDRAIESAIKDNTRAGGFVRGASTISMQLAKNLYLSRDKTLSRKFQEAALTSLLEQNFAKKELLELYVNVVEFGPGIYGVTQAARYYFNTTPDALTASQAFFLGSILPNPTREHFASDGHLKPSALNLVHRLLNISHKRGRLTEDELKTALSEIPKFGEPRPLVPEPEESENPGHTEEHPGAQHGAKSTPSQSAPASTKSPARPAVDPRRQGIPL